MQIGWIGPRQPYRLTQAPGPRGSDEQLTGFGI
jgi:hypothetical protein